METPTEWTYTYIWPIVDDTCTVQQLKTEAAGQLDALAHNDGVTLTGPAKFDIIHGCLLVAMVPAIRSGDRGAGRVAGPIAASARDAQIRRYREEFGWTNVQIGSVLGLSPSYISRIVRAMDAADTGPTAPTSEPVAVAP